MNTMRPVWPCPIKADDGWRDTTAWERTQVIGRHLYENNGREVNNILSYTDFDWEMAGSLTLSV